MARKKIREYDGKRLLQKHLARLSKVNLPAASCVLVDLFTDWAKLRENNPWLLTAKLVAKPDMLFGQRGKHGLVLLNATIDEAEEFIKAKFHQTFEIKGVRGRCTHFLIEPFVPHEEEYYFSINSTRDHNVISFSGSGGVEIEDGWDEKVVQVNVPTGVTVDELSIEKLFASQLPTEKTYSSALVEFVKGCYRVFEELHFTLLEMNPLCLVKDDTTGTPVRALDLVGEVDDTAHFKCQNLWGDLHFPNPFGRELFPEEEYIDDLDAKTGASLKFTVLNEYGRIWNLVAGGGASVIFADTVADLGYEHELANYGEYSGAPSEEETYLYTRTILSLLTRHTERKGRALLIGGGIANFTDIAKTFGGIVRALREFKRELQSVNTRIYVRRAGPNYKPGLKLMREVGDELGIPIQVYGPEVHMTTIVPQAIDYVKQIEVY